MRAKPLSTNPADLDRAALILQIVCAHFSCTAADLESRGPRAKQFAWPRYIAFLLLERNTSMTLGVLGRLFARSLHEAFHLYDCPIPATDPRFDDLSLITSRVKHLLPTLE